MKTRTQPKLNIRDERGFTIVEVLVSLIIFSIAVTGVITVAVRGGLNVDQAKLNLTATYLADEGIELARAMRDTAVVGSGETAAQEADGWTQFTTADGFGLSRCTSDAPCDIDPTIGTTSCPGTADVFACTVPTTVGSSLYCPLYVLATGGYTDIEPSGSPVLSPYSRQIIMSHNGADDVKVTVNVQYKEGTSTQTVTQTEDLFNWYQP